MSVVLFWPRYRRALLASLSLVNVSLSCLHSIHFVSLHSPSQYLSCPHSSNPFLGILDFGGIWQCLACTPSTLSIVSLHSSNPFLWDLGFGQRPALPAPHPLCLTAFSLTLSPIQCKRRSCSPAYKQPTFLGILRFLSFANDLFGVCLCFQKVFLHWFRYRTY